MQVIPHITNEIKARIRRAEKVAPADVVISEIGRTVGDIESLPFLEAIRQFRREVGPENVLYLHVTLVPFIRPRVSSRQADAALGERAAADRHPPRRRRLPLDGAALGRHQEKIALFADVDAHAVVGCPDVSDVYFVPEVLQAEGLDALVCGKLGLDCRPAELGEWQELHRPQPRSRGRGEIALVGKYVKLHDAYLSVHEALKHAGVHHGSRVRVRWVDAENMSYEEAARGSSRSTAFSSPAASAHAAGRARSSPAASPASARSMPRHLPRDARRRVGVRPPCRRARGRELDRDGPRDPVPRDRPPPRAKEIEDLGGTMRLGAQAVELADGTRARDTYGESVVHERHRHRYEVNSELPPAARRRRPRRLGHLPGRAPRRDRRAPGYPWFVASQFHPEFKSRPTRPAPLFREFVGAALERARLAGRSPRGRPLASPGYPRGVEATRVPSRSSGPRASGASGERLVETTLA